MLTKKYIHLSMATRSGEEFGTAFFKDATANVSTLKEALTKMLGAEAVTDLTH